MESEDAAFDIVHERFRFSASGLAVNSELPTVAGFEAATGFVRKEDLTDSVRLGPNVASHLAMIRRYADAGFYHIVLTHPAPGRRGSSVSSSAS